VRVDPVTAPAGDGGLRAGATSGAGGPRVEIVSNGPPRLGLMAAPVPGGLEVRETMPGLPAEAAGLRAGDIVREVNGTPVPELASDALRNALRSLPLALVVEREGARLDIIVEAP
jgi:S1-C subfamily serine protease